MADEIIFTNYALFDPEKAGDRLLQMSDDQRRGAIEGAMAALTGKDPEAALALISRFEQASVDNERRKLVERIVAEDPQKAIGFAQEMVKPAAPRRSLLRWSRLGSKRTKAPQWPGQAITRVPANWE